MQKIISVMSQKGGVGKSTVTVLLANFFYFQLRLRIAIIDADYPQSSVGKKRKKENHLIKHNERYQKAYQRMCAGYEPYLVKVTNLLSVPEILDNLGEEFDFVFVDVTGSMNQPGIADFLKRVHHFFIPVLQDEFSMFSATEFYKTIHGKVAPVSNNFESCHLFFNKVPHKNNVPRILRQLSPSYQVLPTYLSNYTIYERGYRSTLFPIPNKGKKESVKLFQFAQQVYLAMTEKAEVV